MRDFDIPRSQVSFLIDEWIFNERDRAITKRRLLDGVTYECLSEEFDLSVKQTKRIVYKCEDQLFKHFPKKNN